MSTDKTIKSLENEVESINRALRATYEPASYYLALEARKDAFEDALRMAKEVMQGPEVSASKYGYELSVKDLTGSPVKDIYGWASTEFGDPCFKISRIEFMDGRIVDVEGEHDIPYICDEGKVVKLPETVETKDTEE